ncbi:MAG: DNA-protecting protein DprA [candidate division Zixibacteria bacterium]|nr:DNA-protecting protein DprA [candidate division Zixibacteria bacterium]
MEPNRKEHVRASLALARVPGIGSVYFQRLLEAFGGPADVFAKNFDDLAALEGIGGERARAIISFDAWKHVDEEMARAEELGLNLLLWGDDDYPEPLAAIYDPPPVLYYKGALDRLPALALAAVGTRRPSDYGERATAYICEPLAEAGAAVVSGMARGIDACAHRAALKVGGVTVAVLGCGADVVYPPENKSLYLDICASGVVFSEFSPSARPEAQNFPRRNRIISGLAAGVLVVEAGEGSGALITATHAADQGREVFAVPGSIFSPSSDGCRRLIAGGAKPVGSAQEILEEIAPQYEAGARRPFAAPSVALESLGADEQELLKHVAGEPLTADELAARAGWDPARAAAALLALEIVGLVEKLPGNSYRRIYL